MKKIYFHFANAIQNPAAAMTSKLHGYFDLFYHLGLASISFSGKATRWFSRKTHFKASDNRTGFLLFQIIVRLAPAVHLYSLCLFRMSFENVRGV